MAVRLAWTISCIFIRVLYFYVARPCQEQLASLALQQIFAIQIPLIFLRFELPPNFIFQCYRPQTQQFYLFYPALLTKSQVSKFGSNSQQYQEDLYGKIFISVISQCYRQQTWQFYLFYPYFVPSIQFKGEQVRSSIAAKGLSQVPHVWSNFVVFSSAVHCYWWSEVQEGRAQRSTL